MANRVVMGDLPGGGQGLRVSTPGQNALNSNLNGRFVSFDTRWLGACRIFRTGSVTIGANGSSTVNFGTTFASAPPVIAMSREGSIWREFSNFQINAYVFTNPTPAQVVNALSLTSNAAVDVRTNQVIFNNNGAASILVSYIILRI